MNERPILFSGSMVRAIRENRKGQTRRVVKLPKWAGANCIELNERDMPLVVAESTGCLAELPCPYGQPGDRLWVRESCRGEELDSGLDGVRYRADDEFIPIQNTSAASIKWLDLHTYRGHHGAPAGPWVPAIHMPRWASRLLLEVTDVRVERLNDISEEDAKAEGCSVPKIIYPDEPRESYSYAAAYSHLWESINGPGSWAANPWVWVVEFRRVT